MGPGGIALTSVLTPLTAGSLVFCVYKWALWLRHKGFQWSLAQVVLIGNIIGNISMDPLTVQIRSYSNELISSVDQYFGGSDVLASTVPQSVQSFVRHWELAFRLIDDLIDLVLLVSILVIYLVSSNLKWCQITGKN